MMTKKEQIEEMAQERNEIKDIMRLLDKCVSLNPMHKSEVASVLYGNNYRKAEEIRKETAKEIMQCLYDKCYEIQNLRECVAHITPLDILQLAKYYGVEVEE